MYLCLVKQYSVLLCSNPSTAKSVHITRPFTFRTPPPLKSTKAHATEKRRRIGKAQGGQGASSTVHCRPGRPSATWKKSPRDHPLGRGVKDAVGRVAWRGTVWWVVANTESGKQTKTPVGTMDS